MAFPFLRFFSLPFRYWKLLSLLLCLHSERWRLGVHSVVSSVISGLPFPEDDGMRYCIHLSCEKGGNLVRPWGCIFCLHCWIHQRRWIGGLFAIGLPGDYILFFLFFSFGDGGRCSLRVYDTCWRRVHALAVVTFPILGVGGRGSAGSDVCRRWLVEDQLWGSVIVFSSRSRVFVVKLQGCTVKCA
jgi:hypothetical protein